MWQRGVVNKVPILKCFVYFPFGLTVVGYIAWGLCFKTRKGLIERPSFIHRSVDALVNKCGDSKWVIWCQLKDHNEARDALRSCASSDECITAETGSQIPQDFHPVIGLSCAKAFNTSDGVWSWQRHSIHWTGTRGMMSRTKPHSYMYWILKPWHGVILLVSPSWRKVNIPVCLAAVYNLCTCLVLFTHLQNHEIRAK